MTEGCATLKLHTLHFLYVENPTLDAGFFLCKKSPCRLPTGRQWFYDYRTYI